MDEIGSESAVYVHWSQPLHNGSCRIRYKLCFDGNSRVRSIVLDKTSYKLELVEDEIFTFTVYAISQCETVSAKSSPSNFTFAMGKIMLMHYLTYVPSTLSFICICKYVYIILRRNVRNIFYSTGVTYCIAGKFGGELNLAVWQYAIKLPN